MRWMVVALVLAACSGGSGTSGKNGATGPRGPAGADGAPGAPGGAYRWVDASGEVVTVGPELAYVDEAGFVWGVDPEAAELTVAVDAVTVYDSRDCSGDAWTRLHVGKIPEDRPVSPRLVVLVDGQPMARGDEQAEERACYRSYTDDSGCVESAYGEGCDDLFRVDDLTVVERPAVAWTGPLHPEPITP